MIKKFQGITHFGSFLILFKFDIGYLLPHMKSYVSKFFQLNYEQMRFFVNTILLLLLLHIMDSTYSFELNVSTMGHIKDFHSHLGSKVH